MHSEKDTKCQASETELMLWCFLWGAGAQCLKGRLYNGQTPCFDGRVAVTAVPMLMNDTEDLDPRS